MTWQHCPNPIGETIESTVRPNGLDVAKVRVPLGVVFFIYESRPNVTADAAAICLKSGNAVILRGGKEARHSSQAIVQILRATAATLGLPADAIQLVSTTDRTAVGHFLRLDRYIDVAIPRGGENLIRRVADEARMPVIKHFAGNCHVYVDASADLAMAVEITTNAKCQRMGVCNACESLLVHADVAMRFLPQIDAGSGSAWRRDTWRRDDLPVDRAGRCSLRGGLRQGISGTNHFVQGRRLARRSDPTRQPLWFASHGRDRNDGIWRRPDVLPRLSTVRPL